MTNKTSASYDFALSWSSHCAKHKDVMHIPHADFENDILPEGFSEKIRKLSIGETYEETFPVQNLLEEGFSQNKVHSFPRDHFNTSFKQQLSLPQLYRFYPSAIASQGLNTSESDYRPFRLISMNDEEMTADRNHPLAKYFLTLLATRCDDLMEIQQLPRRHIGNMISQKGPGMQVPFEFGDSSFFTDYPFTRKDNNADDLFYKEPKMVDHIDETAQQVITNLLTDLLEKDVHILDLMSSHKSYLPEHFNFKKVVGLGLNEKELNENSQLSSSTIHDLNKEPTLTFETDSFDFVTCNLSFEYLTHPLEVVEELARILKPGGKLIITFSDRWFAEKAITIWPQIHPFERAQYVLECFRKNNLFNDLNTYSKRGLPRPKNDVLYEQRKISDPIFAVWGTVNK